MLVEEEEASNMRYRFKYQASEEDYLEFNKFHAANSAVYKGKFLHAYRWVLGIINFLLSLLYFWGFYDSGYFRNLIAAFVLLVISVLCLRWKWTINRFYLPSAIKKMKKDGKLPYGKENELLFGEDFCVEIADDIETKVKYRAIEKVASGDHAVYVFISAMQAFIIPLSVFETGEQRTEFVAFVNRKIEESRASVEPAT